MSVLALVTTPSFTSAWASMKVFRPMLFATSTLAGLGKNWDLSTDACGAAMQAWHVGWAHT
jgi:hypothetical protein